MGKESLDWFVGLEEGAQHMWENPLPSISQASRREKFFLCPHVPYWNPNCIVIQAWLLEEAMDVHLKLSPLVGIYLGNRNSACNHLGNCLAHSSRFPQGCLNQDLNWLGRKFIDPEFNWRFSTYPSSNRADNWSSLTFLESISQLVPQWEWGDRWIWLVSPLILQQWEVRMPWNLNQLWRVSMRELAWWQIIWESYVVISQFL